MKCLFESVGQESLFAYAVDCRAFCLVEILFPFFAFDDITYLIFITSTRAVLAVTGDERHGGSLGSEFEDGVDLAEGEIEFSGDDVRKVWCGHRKRYVVLFEEYTDKKQKIKCMKYIIRVLHSILTSNPKELTMLNLNKIQKQKVGCM